MPQITVKVPAETADSLAALAEEEFDGNRSAAIRELLRRGTEYDRVKQQRDRLERQYRQLVEQWGGTRRTG